MLLPGPAVESTPGAKDERGERLEADREVDRDVAMPQVPEVVRETIGCALGVRRVIAAQLRPTGDPGLDQQAPGLEGNGSLEHAHELRPLRARSDQGHLALQHVPELRELVEVRPAQEAADVRDAWVVLLCIDGPAGRLRVLLHGAELVHREERAAFADASLPVDDAPGRTPHEEHDEGYEGSGQEHAEGSADEVEHPFGAAAVCALVEVE